MLLRRGDNPAVVGSFDWAGRGFCAGADIGGLQSTAEGKGGRVEDFSLESGTRRSGNGREFQD